MSMYSYIDDILHDQASEESVISTRNVSISLHLQLGFIINLTKSSLVTFQVMTHLSAWIDTLRGVMPTPDRVQAITLASQNLLESGSVSTGHLQSVVGIMASCHTSLCLFRLRPISSYMARNFKWQSDSVSKMIPLNTPEVLEALQFWSDSSRLVEGV